MKVNFFLYMFIGAFSFLEAGRYPNLTTADQIPCADGFAERHGISGQSILLTPRIVATVSHGGWNKDEEVNEVFRINGQAYSIIRKVEEGGLGNRDITLLFLDRSVEGVDIFPIASIDDYKKNGGVPFFIHAISSCCNNIVLERNNAIPPLKGIRYHYGLLDSTIYSLRNNINALSVSIGRINDVAHFIPTGGDSGSPCFVSTHSGGYATVGVVSTIGDNNGTSASYTYFGAHLNWIRNVIERHAQFYNFRLEDKTIKTVPFLEWNLTPAALPFPSTEQYRAARYPYIPEGIRASRMHTVSCSDYRLYQDLSHMNDDQLRAHYNSNGRNEGRLPSMPQNFSPIMYLSMYPDLYAAALGQRKMDLTTYALSHYMNYGINEKRICGFAECPDAQTMNQDLAIYQKTAEQMALEDDLKQVSAEGILANMPDFNSREYKLHNDLSHMTDAELLNHYNNYGRREGRLASLPNTFNWEEYLQIHSDLFPILIDSTKTIQQKEDFAKSHYMNYGFKEKRYCGLPVLSRFMR